jgi:methylenetetrahydrofolate dehydrogenase (NADP+)/methenyltetrahydrofolate cyclohydrolase
MILIDGNLTASTMRKEIKEEVDKMVKSGQRPPHLAVILVGHDGGSETYVKYKIKDCTEV